MSHRVDAIGEFANIHHRSHALSCNFIYVYYLALYLNSWATSRDGIRACICRTYILKFNCELTYLLVFVLHSDVAYKPN